MIILIFLKIVGTLELKWGWVILWGIIIECLNDHSHDEYVKKLENDSI